MNALPESIKIPCGSGLARECGVSVNELAAGSALSDTGSYGTARHGSNVGVQVEYWWK